MSTGVPRKSVAVSLHSVFAGAPRHVVVDVVDGAFVGELRSSSGGFLTNVDAILLDTRIPGLDGGTGVTFDASLAKRLRFDVPIILAGGLTPKNVVERVREIHPYAVDVSSGVESSPGKKEKSLLRRFMAALQAL